MECPYVYVSLMVPMNITVAYDGVTTKEFQVG